MKKIIDCIKSSDLETLKEILTENPKYIVDKDENGIEFFYLVAKSGNFEMMKFVVEYTVASFNEFDKNGRSLLHYAVESKNLALVKYLVEKVGLTIDKGDKNRITPYHIAVNNNLKDITSYFSNCMGGYIVEFYQNPIREGFFPDPSIVRVEDDYYMVNSSFVYFPCIPISHSKDLVNWSIIGHAITDYRWALLEELEGGRGYWAPDISYYEGRFYITATYRMNDGGKICRKQMVVSSVKPEGPYTKPNFIDEDGIDPSIFNDENGKRYMLLNRGARIFELSKDGTEKISEAKLLYYGSQKRAPEGPHLLKKDGWYYLFLAEGGTGINHQISVARSKTLFGNYEPCPYNPIMTQKNHNDLLQCCGHGKPVMTQYGQWYMVYLCNRFLEGKYGILGRETAIDPITWTKDEWPIVNLLKGPSLLQKKPDLLKDKTVKLEKYIYVDDFNLENLNKSWMFIRKMNRDEIKIENNMLCIRGSKYEMNNIKAKNLVLRRQKHFSFICTVKMIVPELIEDQNSGIIAYYDENTYLKYGLFINKKGDYEIRIFENKGSNQIITFRDIIKLDMLKDNIIEFKMKVNGLIRIFSYRLNEGEWSKENKITNTSYLSSEGYSKGKRFTGATLGMYAYEGKKDLNVYFKRFEYIED
jgi:xylan 1,4-beta-xylosidase